MHYIFKQLISMIMTINNDQHLFLYTAIYITTRKKYRYRYRYSNRDVTLYIGSIL